MKSKKIVSALLALVMALSILPMAAFAAEEDHTHDETCGCSSGWAITPCPHLYTPTRVRLSAVSLNDFYHNSTYRDVYSCHYCGDSYNVEIGTIKEGHTITYGAKLYEYSESGETYYMYAVSCFCGYTGTRSVAA